MAFTRMTISVQQDLKRRMDELTGVNWSAVAAEAFEAHLAKRMRGEEMTSMVERLRASRSEHETEMVELGENQGRLWAQNEAEYHELENIYARNPHDLFRGCPNAPYSWGDIVCAWFTNTEVGSEEAVEFRERLEEWLDGPAHIEDGDYLRGFVKGAYEAYGEVRDQL